MKRRAGQRGSTFIIVLAILSLLALIATALSLTTRLEVVSASNYAEILQARMAAKTGLSQAAPREDAQATALPASVQALRSADTAISASSVSKMHGSGVSLASASAQQSNSSISNSYSLSAAAVESDGLSASSSPRPDEFTTPDQDLELLATAHNVSLAQVWMQDAGARLNINTAGEAELAALFDRAGRKALAQDGDAVQLAHAIVSYRQARPANSTTADPLFADLRIPLLEGQKRFQSISELAKLQGAGPALLAASAPYLTVFSVSREFAQLPGGPFLLTDLNSASIEEILSALHTIYDDEKNETLLRQFAVNIADYRDTDSLPSFLPAAPGAEAVLGLERTPFITEVWPNSPMDDELAPRQYFEIYNPWRDRFDLTGWTLRSVAGSIQLQGTLTPGSYLAVALGAATPATLENAAASRSQSSSSVSPIIGSSSDSDGADSTNISKASAAAERIRRQDAANDVIFALIPQLEQGGSANVLSIPVGQIPYSDGQWTLELRDREGHLIDFFTYTLTMPLNDATSSFQRGDPRLRAVTLAPCTPMRPKSPQLSFVEAAGLSGSQRYPANRAFQSRAEILNVFAGWSTNATGGAAQMAAAAVSNGATSLAFSSLTSVAANPVCATPDTPDEDLSAKASSSAYLDARLVDGFTLDPLGDLTAPVDETASDGSIPAPFASTANTSLELTYYRLKTRLTSKDDRDRLAAAIANGDKNTLAILANRALHRPQAGTRLGAVNINSAPEEVLASLTGSSEGLAKGWALKRQELMKQNHTAAAVLFRRPSDILADSVFHQNFSSASERQTRWASMIQSACFSTCSLFLDSRTLSPPVSALGRPAATSRAVALVACDKGFPEFITWGYQP